MIIEKKHTSRKIDYLPQKLTETEISLLFGLFSDDDMNIV